MTHAGHLQPLVTFLLFTGARLSEALYIDWRNVDLTTGRAMFLNRESGGVGTKSGVSRGVPLHSRVIAALEALPHRDGAVFRRHYGGIRADGSIRPVGEPYTDRGGEGGGQVKTGWAAMLKRAGMKDFTPHDCRHTWATWHYAANGNLGALMELGGWKSVAMVMRYAHTNPDHLARSIEAIWGNSGDGRTQSTPNHLKKNAKETL